MSLALATSPAAVAPQDRVCHFDKLPQELLDMVCGFAYGHHTERLIITKGQFMDSLLFLEEAKSSILPPFEHYVNQFLVSKRFFRSAVEAFIKAQRLDQTAPEHYFSSDRISKNKLFQLFAKDITIELVLNENKFTFSSSPTTHFPWVHAFQEEDFAHLNIVKHVGALRGVKTLTIKAGVCLQADTGAKKQMWQRNIDALQKYLTSIVTAPKPRTAATEPTTTAVEPATTAANSPYVELPPRLYPDSRVSGTESGLITPTVRLTGSVPDMASQVMALDRTDLRQWLERALQEHPELARPLQIANPDHRF
ncbi:hypothetical protein CKM354_001225700 [Cercospora kikuchii]|uniref:Uncharacterized protein n=1 Tax=Cercospora kikuchii TaxID=84275 RepID=A0A9P3FLM3_9PEZI|nr:uncharacterized protein CKM354_001225700 [Cercospora kikuchii]GIZ49222.1 hypothetical protein CKM354_001225700 [Cercospora kikuchii]